MNKSRIFQANEFLIMWIWCKSFIFSNHECILIRWHKDLFIFLPFGHWLVMFGISVSICFPKRSWHLSNKWDDGVDGCIANFLHTTHISKNTYTNPFAVDKFCIAKFHLKWTPDRDYISLLNSYNRFPFWRQHYDDVLMVSSHCNSYSNGSIQLMGRIIRIYSIHIRFIACMIGISAQSSCLHVYLISISIVSYDIRLMIAYNP